MFNIPKHGSRRSTLSLLASFLLHCLILFLWLHRTPLFVKSSSVAWGQRGQSDTLVYFPRTADLKPVSKQLLFRAKQTPKSPKEVPEKVSASARSGVPYGSLYHGPGSGIEARPALPIVFPDPPIYPWQLPRGLQGDVIVEVTIDEQGNVTETRLLQSLQEDIDEKVITTLRNWHFKPATLDGTAISSRQDVHFHFPS